MNTQEIMARVMGHWSPPEYYVLTEVRNGTGYSRREGYADVLAMSVWPSRGLEIIGAEVKSSRSDWLREKVDPQKAEKFQKHCHRWYLITGPDVVKEESEIPPAWGWMVAGPKGLKTIKAAPVATPIGADLLLMASIFRKIGAPLQGFVPESEIQLRVNASLEKRLAELAATQRYLEEQKEKAHQSLALMQRAMAEFNAASGVDLYTPHSDRDLGEWRRKASLFRSFHSGEAEKFEKELAALHVRAENIASQISFLCQKK